MKNLFQSQTRFRPHVESLEDRSVPTTISVVGSTMTIQGDSTSEIIDIRDNGDGDLTVLAGPRAVVLAGGGTFRTANNITTIRINARGGDDIVRYFQTADRTRSMNLEEVKLGNGRDVFLADIEGDLGNTQMIMNVNGGDHGDSITVDATTDSDRSPFDPLDSIGVDIGSFGALILDLDGGGGPRPSDWSVGRDSITFDYRGVMDGLLLFAERGGGGADNLHADVQVLCGSDGVMGGVLNGGQGKDRLFFHIREVCPDDQFSIGTAVARGGGGNDSFDLTPNVRRRNI